jgi:hypothetical protein
MESLTDPCLSDDWNAYSAYADLFAMLAILAMQLIEFIVHHQLHQIPKKENFFVLRKRFKLLYFGALYLSATGMVVIVRWA